MLRRLVLKWAIIGVAFAITTELLGGIKVRGGFWGYVWVAALFGIVNAVIGPIVRILTLPVTLLTLGLFALVVNAGLLAITAALSDRLTIDRFWTAFFAAIIIAVVSAILNRLLVPRKDRD
jgi:putative membrane protein